MDLVFVSNCNDWEGLYVDGKIVAQNHVLSVQEVLDALNWHYETLECSYEWLNEIGSLPDDLSDVQALEG